MKKKLKTAKLWKCNVFFTMSYPYNLPFDLYLKSFYLLIIISLTYALAACYTAPYYKKYFNITDSQVIATEWYFWGIHVGILSGFVIYEIPTRVACILFKWNLIPKSWGMRTMLNDLAGFESCDDGYEEDGCGKPKTM
jgi:hypothetical protein